MSLSGLTSITKTNTTDADAYDHVINLVDGTHDSVDAGAPYEEADTTAPAEEPLARKLTRNTLRSQLARRKYAKWQDGRRTLSSDGADENDEDDGTGGTAQPEVPKETGRLKRLGDKVPFRSQKPTSTPSKKQRDTAIDILYENQRGAFFCGIPLYSSASLLHVDPAGWQNAMFQDSPVNITNAQVPDPSWSWGWKTWYVDMSHDVDDEGWEYSLAFGTNFSWHGSHPWFHSFVRRRRWLRRRVRTKAIKSEAQGGPQASHMLNQDYFTIHMGRDESPDSRAEQVTKAPSTFLATLGDDTDTDFDGDMHNTAQLLTALKHSMIDRQKIALVANFLEHGGEELHYLANSMPEIMSLLVYDTSRNHLCSKFEDAMNRLSKEIEEGTGDESASRVQQRDDIEQAIRTIRGDDDVVDGLGRPRAQETRTQRKLSNIDTRRFSINVKDDIKGIPDSAGLSDEGIRWASGPTSPASVTSSKGKGRL